MNDSVLLVEDWDRSGNLSYSVVDDEYDKSRYDSYVDVAIGEPNIFIFDFQLPQSTNDTRFTIAVYTLDEALHVFLNTYKGVTNFMVTVKP